MISIIIPTLNEEKLLPALLESIKRQTFKGYEVIVSDACSTDSTLNIAEGYSCRIVAGNGKGVSIGRNNGAKVAKGDVLIFLDADIILPKDFMENAVKEFKQKSLASSTASLTPLTTSLTDKLMYSSYNFWQKLIQYIDPHAVGSCIITKKDVFKKLNGFDETISFCEDHDYARRSKKLGKFRVLNSTKAYNSVRRLDSEGRYRMAIKMLAALFHRTFIGEIRHKKFIWSPGVYNKKNIKSA